MILTCSTYSQADDHVEELVGVFPDLAAAIAWIKKEWSEDDDSEVIKFSAPEKPDKKPGLTQTLVSEGGLDNGYGGRYFSVWEAS